jgi:AcrR family transcriptional regulator
MVFATVAAMGTRERRTRRRRLPPEEGRRALLEAGRDHVYEHPLGEPLDHVRVTDIVERIGLSIGAVYHYWESQDDYRDDLIDLLLSPDQFPNVEQAAELVGAALDDEPSFEELARAVAGISFQGLAVTPERERLTLALIAYGDRDIDAQLGAQADAVGRRWAELFATHFPAYGLEPRPPFSYASIAATLMALVEGMHLRRTVSPDAVTAELAPGWDLFASSALAFILGATRPADATDDIATGARDLWALAERAIPRRTPARG